MIQMSSGCRLDELPVYSHSGIFVGRAGVSIFLISSAWSDFTLDFEISLVEALHDGNEPKVQIGAFAL